MYYKVTRLTRSEEKQRHKDMFAYYKKNIKKWERDGVKRDAIYEDIKEMFGFRSKQSVNNLICRFLNEDANTDWVKRRKVMQKEKLERKLEELKKELED